jgi:hypothetical protein
MAYYDVLNASDGTDMQSIMSAANRLSGDIFMPVMLLVIFSVWVLGSVFMGKSIGRAVLFGSFICSILAVPMVLMNWLSVNYMYFCFLMVAIGAVWVKLDEAAS